MNLENTLSPIEELDETLKALVDETKYRAPLLIVEALRKRNISIKLETIRKVLGKLVKDGFVDMQSGDYSITWEGRYFIVYEEGYSGKLRQSQKDALDIQALQKQGLDLQIQAASMAKQ